MEGGTGNGKKQITRCRLMEDKPEEPYKDEINRLLSLSKFAIICIMIAGGFLGQEFLL